MAEKLQVYNLALAHLKERRLARLAENREPKRVLDDVWDQVVAECLAEALWNHTIRAVQMEHSASMTPALGFAYAFTIPNDFSRLIEMSADEAMYRPLRDFREEAGVWYANVTPLYARYVSSSVAYGGDLSLWPANFTAWVGFKLAEYSCNRITGSDEYLKGPEGIVRRGNKRKLKAKSTDAMNETPRRPPPGSWVTSRYGGSYGQSMPNGDMFDD